ncbi:MAG TPA: hypothetical protein VMU27_03250 [Candidatus Paceibacterota bacterium]|nr:hypothetical protein [Candidatus Paceibacterota bacterium]
MKLQTIGAAAVGVLAIFSVAGLAFAQTSNTVIVSTTNASSTPAAGTSATLGTITLSGTNGGTYTISSIPVSLSVANGGTASYLSNCQILNNGTSLVSGANIPTMQAGTNTFTFNTPLTIPANTSETLTLQCSVSASSPSGATYQVTAGNPVISSISGVSGTTATSTSSSTTASLSVMFSPISSVRAGLHNGVLGLIVLDASSSNQSIRVSSLPLSITFGGVTSTSYLSNCGLHSATNLATALNTGVNAVTAPISGTNVFVLDTPLMIPTGSAEILALTCDVSSGAPIGAKIDLSLTPPTINASGATGVLVTPTTEVSSNGTVEPTSGTVVIAAPNSGSGSGTTGSGSGTTSQSGVPGTPNTGAGGEAPLNFFLLALSALAATGGAGLLLKRKIQ